MNFMFLPREHKIHIFSPPCNILYINYQLRGSNILSLPRINTTSYGSKSIRYFGPKIWNFLDDNLRTQPDLQSFKKFVRLVDFENLKQFICI